MSENNEATPTEKSEVDNNQHHAHGHHHKGDGKHRRGGPGRAGNPEAQTRRMHMSENNEIPTERPESGHDKHCGHRHHHKCGDKRRRCGHGRAGHFIMAALAIVGIVSIANIAFGAGPCDKDSTPTDRASKVAMHMLDDVDASDEQRAQVKGIIETHSATLNSLRKSGRKLHEETRALLSAPTIDRSAIENLRQQKIASMDKTSQEMTTMLADIAEVLTPEQRKQLAENMQKRFEHHRHGSWDH